ncbi:MAG: hypothetical protein ACJA0V_004442, partial [Planctomycetota bacterium]
LISPNAEKAEHLAREAKPLRTEPVVDVQESESLRAMMVKDSRHDCFNLSNERLRVAF